MITGLPPKSTDVRLNGDPDTNQTLRALDSLRSPLDLVLAFLNGIFTGNSTALGLSIATLTLSGALKAGSVVSSGPISGTTGTFTGAISAASGFKTSVYMGCLVGNSAGAGGTTPMQFYSTTSNITANYVSGLPMTLLQLTVAYGTSTATNQFVQVYDVTAAAVLFTAPTALPTSGFSAISYTIPGTAVAANHVLEVRVTNTAAGTENLAAYLLVST